MPETSERDWDKKAVFRIHILPIGHQKHGQETVRVPKPYSLIKYVVYEKGYHGVPGNRWYSLWPEEKPQKKQQIITPK